MANTANITITGNLTKDPVRFGNDDQPVARFDVAVNGRIREDGEWKDHASFYRVVCFGRLADQVLEHLVKGRKVCVSGTCQIMPAREHNGRTYVDVEISATGVEFLSAPSDVSAEPLAVGADTGQAGGGVGSQGWDGEDLGF